MTPLRTPASLEEVLAYAHDPLVERLAAKLTISESEARQLFDDVKRWLWLTQVWAAERRQARPDVPEQMAILWTQRQLDDAWHEFILFTQDYAAFCERHFGTFVHHLPTAESEKRERETSEDWRARYREVARDQVRFVVRHLGTAVATRWYVPTGASGAAEVQS